MNRNHRKINIVLFSLLIVAVVLFLSVWLYTYKDLIIGNLSDKNTQIALLKISKRRIIQMLGIVVSVVLVTISSLVFQTITNNRILTPSVLGFDAIYVITQTLIVFLLGTSSLLISNYYINFTVSVIAMVIIVLLMFVFILRKNKNNIILLLLLGLVLTQLSTSIGNLLQVFMHPEDFQTVTEITNVNINNINDKLVLISIPITFIIGFLFIRENHYLDVMALGEDEAKSLGVEYNKKVNYYLVLIAISIALATALIGPLSFLGLIVVNSSKELTKSNKHKTLIFTSSLLGVVLLLFGQVILEVTKVKTPVTVIVSLIGGAYMIYMLYKENKQ